MKMILRDLISDIRCAERDKMPKYADKCRRDLKKVFPLRHTGGQELNIYGWPTALAEVDA